MPPITVTHVTQGITVGGAGRALAAVAGQSRRLGDYHHRAVSLGIVQPEARDLLSQAGVQVLEANGVDVIHQHCLSSDIVQVEWWNTPEMDTFLRSSLPPMRAVAWCHVGGEIAPQAITPDLVEFFDFVVGCSPHTYLCSTIQNLSPEVRLAKTSMAYGATDFSRLDSLNKQPHTGFNVGYIGTLNFVKMHRDFIQLNNAVRIPEAKFIVCGQGDHEQFIKIEAHASGQLSRYDFRGYVSEVRDVLSELDVYGYPLCEDTYAGSELTLQEVLYAGIPAVVFPYGGVKELIVNDFTGYVVRSALEYRDAIEYLYHSPQERLRLGNNATLYARQIFSAETAAKRLHNVYSRLIVQPKRTHEWPQATTRLSAVGAERFLQSLGNSSQCFVASTTLEGIDELFAADGKIGKSSPLLSYGISSYKNYYPNDPYLHFWEALGVFERGDYARAAVGFLKANELGLRHWRIIWYFARSALLAGDPNLALEALNKVSEVAPEFQPAQELRKSLVV